MGRCYAPKTLSDLFRSQINTLRERELPSLIINHFENQRHTVLEKSSRLELGRGIIPFLPVIPFTFRSYYDQMPMLRFDSYPGQNNTCHDGCILLQSFYPHRTPWYIYSITITPVKNTEEVPDVIQRLEGKGRRILTPEEVISLCLHVAPRNMRLHCGTHKQTKKPKTYLVNRPETHLRTSLPSYTNIPFQDRGPVMRGGCGDHIPSCIL